MLGSLLSGVGYLIYWIFTYDSRFPNDISNSDDTDSNGV